VGLKPTTGATTSGSVFVQFCNFRYYFQLSLLEKRQDRVIFIIENLLVGNYPSKNKCFIIIYNIILAIYALVLLTFVTNFNRQDVRLGLLG